MDVFPDIESQDLVFLDVETTGLSPSMGEAVCEIGAVKMRGEEVIAEFQTLVNPQKSIPFEVYLIHKISNDDVRDAPVFADIAPKLLEFLKDSIICAYNAGFDMGFINNELVLSGYPRLGNPVIDILTMARQVLVAPRYNLETVAGTLGIDCPGSFHRALSDSYAAGRVFFRLTDILREKGVFSLKEIISGFGRIK